MGVVRLLGFTTLPCGCVVGHYREIESREKVSYLEVKGGSCESAVHRRNHKVSQKDVAVVAPQIAHARAS